jgi:epoxyqueuosine reductase
LKLAAIRAGLGWQGKNSLLLNKEYGTFLALGGILTDADLEQHAEPEPDRCKGCTKCQQACPTQALEQACVLNKERCLSFLLQNEDLPDGAKSAKGNRVMDCETCQQVCPWNAKHIRQPLPTARTIAFRAEAPAWEAFFALDHLVQLTEQEYQEALGPLNTGIPYAFFRRNVLLALE